MGMISTLLESVSLPNMVSIQQCFDATALPNDEIPTIIFEQLNREEITSRITPGARIAITAGSRGISHIPLIIKSIASFIKSKDAIPFVVPAMGSHGGATAEGQLEVLASYGITEESVGCQILSSMEAECIGKTERGDDVFIDKNAYHADGILVCGRIKPHTGFRGPYESGLMKMMAIGLGKQAGAEHIHKDGFGHLKEYIPMYGKAILKYTPVIGGLAILENAYDQTRELVGLTPEEIITEEPKLLDRAKSYMPRLLFDSCDVLIVDEISKNISGDGMDPNITGRFPTPYATGGIQAQRVVALSLTPQSHGNACGIGLADFTTQHLYQELDFEQTYPNAITNTVPGLIKIPMVLYNDKEAIQAALKSCNDIDNEQPRIIRIKNTLALEYIEISEALLSEAKQNPNINITSDLYAFTFDEKNNIV